MAGTKTVIRLSYDIVSPWSYLAYVVLKRYRPRWNFDLVINPVWLGGVILASQNTPPFKVPQKHKKMTEELPLMAKFFGVEYHPSAKFPVNTLHLMRFLRVVQHKAPNQLEPTTDKLYEAMFVQKTSAEDLELITRSLIPHVFDEQKVQEYIAISKTPENKELVKRDAEELVKQGAFGFPWIEVTKPNGERLTIFGSDRFEFLANWLGNSWQGPNPDAQAHKSHL